MGGHGITQEGWTMCEKYNGWANYETWAVALWINNEQGSQEMVLDWAQENETGDLADLLKDMHTDGNPLECEESATRQVVATPSVYNDLLTAALSSVDWYELAKSFKADAAEQDKYARTQ